MSSADAADWNGFLVLPWVRLPREARVGPFRFVPVDLSGTGRQTAYPLDQLKERMGIFCEIVKDEGGRQKPVRHCTVLAHDGADSLDHWPLDLDVQGAVDALCFGCIAENQFFTWPGVLGPVTNDHFEWHSIGKDFYVSRTLRRGPGKLSSWSFDEIGITRALHCEERVDARWDEAFVAALYEALTKPTERQTQIVEAIPLFNAAHTGNARGLPQQGIVLVVQALEKLLGVGRRAKALATATAVSDCLEGSGRDVAVFSPLQTPDSGLQARRVDAPLLSDDGKKQWPQDATLLFEWAFELYQVRNDLVHARPLPATYAWDIKEHLVMTSFVFPLLVKSILAAEGEYQPSVSDVCRIGALYTLLRTSGWEEKVSGNTSAWQQVFNLMGHPSII